ncbi:MAG: 16S rRNA (cytosine(1402)-N(4))-methyltransferase RsmH, partial [Gemmataceae bacterium]
MLPRETLALLDPQPGETWVDCTTGVGGHAAAIARAIGPTGRLLAIDQDAGMLERARPALVGLPVELIHANFEQLPELLMARNITAIDGLLADLGFCSDQLADATRGLSFQTDGPLDMRLNPASGFSAADAINTWDERTLADTFFEYGDERHSRRIARAIVNTRPFTTTKQLADVVRQNVPRTADSARIHPATRVFQALRIAVNDELGVLERLLAILPLWLRPGGRVGLISFHS